MVLLKTCGPWRLGRGASIFPVVVAATTPRVVATRLVSPVVVMNSSAEVVMDPSMLVVVLEAVLYRGSFLLGGFRIDRSLPLKARGSRLVL
jgi:hypothetical protein